MDASTRRPSDDHIEATHINIGTLCGIVSDDVGDSLLLAAIHVAGCDIVRINAGSVGRAWMWWLLCHVSYLTSRMRSEDS